MGSESEPRSSDSKPDLVFGTSFTILCVCACLCMHKWVCTWAAQAGGVTGGSGTHLLILQLHSDDSEGAAGSVVVDVDPAETLLAGFDGYPFLTGVIVDHHGSPGLADTLFTAEQEKT